jgi:hypothetical protein
LRNDTAHASGVLRLASRFAHPLVLSTALALGAVACSKMPDAPGRPAPATPKAALAAPLPPGPTGVMRIPVAPDGPAPVQRPVRIWI